MKKIAKLSKKFDRYMPWFYLPLCLVAAIVHGMDGEWATVTWIVGAAMWCLGSMLQQHICKLQEELLDGYREQNTELHRLLAKSVALHAGKPQ